MKDILNYFEQLGFSRIEAKIYITLLDCGPLTVAELAEKAKINRTSAYFHINSLIDKSMVHEIAQETKKKVVACAPDCLTFLVDKKIAIANGLKAEFPMILASLNSLIPEETSNNKSED